MSPAETSATERSPVEPSPFDEAPALRQVVALVFPTLDLSRVEMVERQPWLVRPLRPGGITLPHPRTGRRVRVCVRKPIRPHRGAHRLGFLLHELYHALQAQELEAAVRRRRLPVLPGFLHPFILIYLAESTLKAFRYSRHPMELVAFERFGGRGSAFERAFLGRRGLAPGLPWSRLAPGQPALSPEELERARGALAPYVTPEAGPERSGLRKLGVLLLALLWLPAATILWALERGTGALGPSAPGGS